MPGIGPVAHLQQDGLEEPYLDHFAAHAPDSTQSPTRTPLRPMSWNHPRNANRKSFKATVNPPWQDR